MKWLKSVWNWICGGVKGLLGVVAKSIIERAKAIAKEKDLVELALVAIAAAAKEGLTGDKAWVKARDEFTKALKESGKELGDCAIDTVLQVTYDAWKNRKVD
jgi:hypothetical protein